MQGIRYKRHFLLLVPAATVFWLATKAADLISAMGTEYLFLTFGSMGVLHATSLVVSLENRTIVTLRRSVLFVLLVASVSVLAVFSPLLLAPVPRELPLPQNDAGFLLILGFGSAFGASGYWFLLRWFWLKSRPIKTLIPTVVLCSGTTLIGWPAAGALRPTSDSIALLLPTVAWWAAFSFSLYCGDVQLRIKNSIPVSSQGVQT